MINKKILVGLVLLALSISIGAQEIVVPRLSPMSNNRKTFQIDLNGTWMFSSNPQKNFWTNPQKEDCKPIEVPGEWVMQGFEVAKGEKAGYYRTFDIPSDWQGKRVKIRCNGAYSESTVYINGHEIGYHLGGFTPFEYDVTPHLNYGGQNQITISVVNESVADSLASGSKYAVHPLGGITRDIYVFALEETNLSMFHASTDFDDNFVNATLTTEVEVANESNTSQTNLKLYFTLRDKDNNTIELKNNIQNIANIQAGKTQKLKVDFDVAKPEQWTSEHPYLYTFTCELRDGNKMLHNTTRHIGFREVEVRGNELFVNNKPVKLRGVCRHEVMPLRGRSLTGNIWEKDVKLFREANVNYIRTSHYPPDEALLEACDRLGMFVEEEAPFCWAHETKVTDDNHYLALVNQHIEMVNRDRSHPSVIMWSMGNESNLFTEYFKQAADIVKQIDPSRPRIFSQWGPDADNGELEVTNHHYPGPEGPNMYRNSKRPVTFDEFCHLNAYNRLELATDPGLRNMWGVLLDRMWDDMYKSKGVLGGALWAAIDDTFFLPDGGAVGYGTWGPIDGWRRPKPEYWSMKKAYSPVRIKQKGNVSTEGILQFDVDNRHNFTNLSDCKIRWKAGDEQGTIAIDLEARKEGSFEIKLPQSAHNNSNLYVTVVSPLDYIIDEYNFIISPECTDEREQPKGKIDIKKMEDKLIITTVTNIIELDKRNGKLKISDKHRKLIISNSPSLMVLPLNEEGRGIQMTGKDQNFDPYTPIATDWVCQSVQWVQEKEKIIIYAKGKYSEAEGMLVYEIKSDGDILFSYDFSMLKDVSPRQVGLVFNLPSDYVSLKWKRKGYWNTYPENHLGSLEGEAVAYDDKLPISGLAGPDKEPSVEWAYDQTKAGSNLFRSTKENIFEANLYSKNKDGVVNVKSDGTQHVRAWMDENIIRMLVADYNNAGKERFLIPHAEKDYHPLRRGDVIKGTIKINTQN